MATDNGTRLVALFHDQSLSQDRFRLTAIVAGGQLQAQFFGFGTARSSQTIPSTTDSMARHLRCGAWCGWSKAPTGLRA
jgi:hypothetical protein